MDIVHTFNEIVIVQHWTFLSIQPPYNPLSPYQPFLPPVLPSCQLHDMVTSTSLHHHHPPSSLHPQSILHAPSPLLLTSWPGEQWEFPVAWTREQGGRNRGGAAGINLPRAHFGRQNVLIFGCCGYLVCDGQYWSSEYSLQLGRGSREGGTGVELHGSINLGTILPPKYIDFK